MVKKKRAFNIERRAVYAPKRIENELKFLQDYSHMLPQIRNLKADPADAMHWTALILPDNALYKDAAFQIDIRFPREYPFRPPHIFMVTKIYHPNIDENGSICLPCIATELWKPTTRMDQILQALVALVDEPNPYDPIHSKYGQEYLVHYHSFCIKAMYVTRKFGLQRPKPLRRKKLL